MALINASTDGTCVDRRPDGIHRTALDCMPLQRAGRKSGPGADLEERDRTRAPNEKYGADETDLRDDHLGNGLWSLLFAGGRRDGSRGDDGFQSDGDGFSRLRGKNL